MIPYTIFFCSFDDGGGCPVRVRALEMAPDFFTFRLSRERSRHFTKFPARMGFYSWKENTYRIVFLGVDDYRLVEEGREEYAQIFRLETADGRFRKAAKDLMGEYMAYIRLKLEVDEAGLARALTGYDVDEDHIPADARAQKRRWAASFPRVEGLEHVQTGLLLQGPDMEDAFLRLPFAQFMDWYQEDAAAGALTVTPEKISHIHLGNSFCSRAFPDDKLEILLDRCLEQGKKPVVEFSPMDEDDIPLFQERLARIEGWSRQQDREKTEIVVNDLGMFYMLNEKNYQLEIDTGPLLMKRRKDTRGRWKRDREGANGSRRTSMDDPRMIRLLLSLSVTGISYENMGETQACAADFDRRLLYFPYFQMNTSTWCPLYAAVFEGARGRQSRVDSCPKICRSACFLYSDDLHMTGRFNSLFGWAGNLCQAGNYDRVVLNFFCG